MDDTTFLAKLSSFANSQIIKAQGHEASAAKLAAGLPDIPKKHAGPGLTEAKLAEVTQQVQDRIDQETALAESARGRAKSAAAGFFRLTPTDRAEPGFMQQHQELYSAALQRNVVHAGEKKPR
jgi:hypothetical protein